MDLILPAVDLVPPAPSPSSTVRTPVDPSATDGYPAALDGVRTALWQAHGAMLGNAWLGGFAQPGTLLDSQLALTAGVAQIVIPGTDGTPLGIRVEKPGNHRFDITQAGLLVLRWNGWRSGGVLSVNFFDPTTFDIAAGAYNVNGVEVAGNAALAQALSASANTSGPNEYRKILVTIDASGTYGLVYGVTGANRGDSLRPLLPPDTAEVGVIQIDTNFTAGTTNLATLSATALFSQQPASDPFSFGLLPLPVSAAQLSSAVPLCYVTTSGGNVIWRDARRPRLGRPRTVMGAVSQGLRDAWLIPINLGGFVLFAGEALLLEASATAAPVRVNPDNHAEVHIRLSRADVADLTLPHRDTGMRNTDEILGGTFVQGWGTGSTADERTYGTSLWPLGFRALYVPTGALPAFYDFNGLALEISFPEQTMNILHPTLSASIIPARQTDTSHTVPWWHRSLPTSFTPAPLPGDVPTVSA